MTGLRETFSGLPGRQRRIVVAVTVLVLAGAAALVGTSLRRPAISEFAPSPVEARPAGDTLVGPRTYTVDASDPDRWRFFSFRRGTVVEDPSPGEWDLAFRRFHVVANGGEEFAGEGGIADLGEVPFDSVLVVPAEGYVPSEAGRDTTNAATEGWYDYSFTSHVLRSSGRTYAVRTADGRYAKLRMVGYYCPEARPGCPTFEYVYQGGGGRRVAPDDR